MNTAQPPPALTQLAAHFHQTARVLEEHFLDKQEIIRLMMIAVIAGEHLLLVGPPGTAKSALIRLFARLIDARYFEYLLTRFTEPNELFGPVDMRAFRDGEYRRRIAGMLPEAEIVFLDEVFKANSAILNSLLTLLNERQYTNGANLVRCPLLSVFGASNDVPNDDNLGAIFDRFLLRISSNNLDSYHFHGLISRGMANEVRQISGAQAGLTPLISSQQIHQLHRGFGGLMQFSDAFLTTYKGLIFQIRSEGISVSDRRVVKLTKLFAASALFDGRPLPCEADFFLLKYIWNHFDQAETLTQIVSPVVERYYREHPEERRLIGPTADLEALLKELQLIRDLLTSGSPISDIQLFSQLRNLNQIKTALQLLDNPTAKQMLKQTDELLESIFASSKFV